MGQELGGDHIFREPSHFAELHILGILGEFPQPGQLRFVQQQLLTPFRGCSPEF